MTMKIFSALASIALLFNSVDGEPFNLILPAPLPNFPLGEFPNFENLPNIPTPPPAPSTQPTTTGTRDPLGRALKQLRCVAKCANGCKSEKELQQCVMNCHAYCQIFA